VAFSGRLYAANQPQNAGGKYVNSPESDFFHKGRILYGFNFARSAFKDAGWALVCEGQLDVIACHRSGLGQAIAAQGTAFTEEHARMLRKANVTNVHLAFDGDPAGLKAAARTIKLLHAESIQVMVTPLPGGTDPDSIFRSGGPSALGKIMDHAVGAVDFTFAKARAAHPENTPEAKSAIVSEMMDVIASIQDSVARTGHCQILAKELSLPENVIFDLLASIQQKNLDHARRTRDFQRPASEMPVNVRGGAAAPPPSGGGMPVFHAPAPQGSPVAETLLDLALSSRQVAVELTTCDLLEYLPTSPVAQALTMLLASTAEDEWEYGVTILTSGEFISDSAVSRIMTAPQFASSSPEILEQAKNDCLRRLELVRLDREYAGIQDAIKNDPNDFSLLLRAREIIRLRMELQKRK
jgi:DNA primase